MICVGDGAMGGDVESLLLPGERLDDLQRAGLRLIQDPRLYSFSIDAVLLAAFARAKHRDVVVDVGTGTGVIPLLMWGRWRPSHIYGVEIQPQLADMARRSVILNGLEGVIDIIEGDVRDITSLFDHNKVDVVVCNPPYHPLNSGRAQQSTVNATARVERLLCIPELASAASRMLKSAGRLAMVHRPERLTELLAAISEKHIEPKRIQFVHPSASKPAKMVLLEAVKDGGRQLAVLPPLFIQDQDGQYTDEIKRLYSEAHDDGD